MDLLDNIRDKITDSIRANAKEEIKKPGGWRYTGPGIMAGRDLLSKDGEQWYKKNKNIFRKLLDMKAFDKETFRKARKKFGKDIKDIEHILVEPKWDTPDECSYKHDLQYLQAEDCKNDDEKKYKEFEADLEYVRNVREFIVESGKRRVKYDKMNNEYKGLTLQCYFFMIKKIMNDYLRLINGPYADKIRTEFGDGNWQERLNKYLQERLNEWNKANNEYENLKNKKGALIKKNALCGAPRVGHGSEGLSCRVKLGDDGVCPYHG